MLSVEHSFDMNLFNDVEISEQSFSPFLTFGNKPCNST